jgi:hypothetical protein
METGMPTQSELGLLIQLREWASEPGALFYTLRGRQGMAAIFPEDVLGKTDEQLLAFILTRCKS